MNCVRKSISIFLLITTPPLATAAQNPPPKPPAAESAATEKARTGSPLLQEITAALDQVIEAQKSFADEKIRVMIRAQIADMLWRYDEPRARRLFNDALQVSEKLADQDASVPPRVGIFTYPARSEIIRLIMAHDSEWATRLVESRGEIVSDLKARSLPKNRERTGLQLQLIVYLAQHEPRLASLAARPFAEAGDFMGLMTLLGWIRFKDVKGADDLFLIALAKARLGQPSFEDVGRFATYVYPAFGEGVIRFPAPASGRDPFAPANNDPALVAQFLDFAYDIGTRRLNAALTGANGARLDARSPSDFGVPRLLALYFDRFIPDQAPAFRARVQEALRRVPPDDRPYLALSEAVTVEELISRADAISDPRLKDTLLQRAALQASSAGDFQQAEAIIGRLNSEGARSSARRMLRQRVEQKRSDEAWAALNKGDYDKAEALAAQLSDWRTDGLLAGGLIGQLSYEDKARAARILDDYERRAANMEEPTERSLRLMQLAGYASRIDLSLGFEKIKRAIAEFNRAGFVPELQRYRDNDKGGVTGDPADRVNIGLSGLLNNWDLRWLGRIDFERGVALAQQVQMREAAALIQLNVCRAALDAVPSSSR